MSRFAVIDVGTNSVKLHVAERRGDGSWQTLVDYGEVTRLGEGLQATPGSFSAAARQRTLSVLEGMMTKVGRFGVEAIAGVGTMALRTAVDAADFVREAGQRTGLRLEVISAAEETRLGYLATTAGLDLGDSPVLVFDTGGGSTQFTRGRGAGVTHQFSINLGAVRLTEAHHLDAVVTAGELDRVYEVVGAELSGLDEPHSCERLVGMGGGITTLAAVMIGLEAYDASRVHGAELTRSEVERQIELYRTRSAEARRLIPGLQPQRAEVILAGACIVRGIMDRTRAEIATVSDRGLRHGVLLDRFGA